jgi:cellobiose-specific phosphotransferase system component IIB
VIVLEVNKSHFDPISVEVNIIENQTYGGCNGEMILNRGTK